MTPDREPRPLIHPRVRTAFREACSDFGVVRQIERAFEDEGFDAATEDGHEAGRILSGPAGSLGDIPVEDLKDALAIIEHLDRIAVSTHDELPRLWVYVRGTPSWQ